MSVATVDHTITIAMSVKDRQATVAWYEKMLGFPLSYHIEEAGWSEVKTNTPGVSIGFAEQVEPAPGNAVPVFGVTDIDAERAKLETAGVKFDGETLVMEGMVATATFYDPDGNALMLAQDLMN